ncbi:hypothetical protein BDV19DRAFT_374416 [Aspergillus venezuelensis]
MEYWSRSRGRMVGKSSSVITAYMVWFKYQGRGAGLMVGVGYPFFCFCFVAH